MSYKTSREAWARNRIPLEPTEARIRELEADTERWAALAGANLPQLQARIRELEASRNAFQDLAEEKARRITRAKEILKAELEHVSGAYFPEFIEAVIAALEGK